MMASSTLNWPGVEPTLSGASRVLETEPSMATMPEFSRSADSPSVVTGSDSGVGASVAAISGVEIATSAEADWQ